MPAAAHTHNRAFCPRPRRPPGHQPPQLRGHSSATHPTFPPCSFALPRPLSPANHPGSQAINRSSEIIECQQSAVDLDRILGLQSFDLGKILDMDPAFLKVGGCMLGMDCMLGRHA